MSAEVDQRVVSMQFDNAQFEKGVQQTLLSLNNLDNSINKAASQNGRSFTGLINSLNGVDQKITTGILPTMDLVNSKFSFMGVMADQWLRNMATSVQGFVHNTLNSMFQIRGGMNEYELKMGSIQTIMKGTGESLKTVTGYLDELNTYSDKTIYSFKDMTDNIGKFTNQGVKLNDAVNAIKGIANEAALSGANAMQASHAMYNFAQALSSGYVKLIDWKSIENSMMATVGFKNALLETAAALGTVVKQGDKYVTTTTNAQGKVSDLFNAQKGFNDSLQNQWLTSDVLTKTLELYATDVRELTDAEKAAYEAKLRNIGMDEQQIEKFERLGIEAADAATEIKTFSMLVDTITEAIGSGWAKTFEIIFGDFNEAKALWTGLGKWLGKIVDGFSDARNNFLDVWKKDGGRTSAIYAFVNALNAIDAILRPIGQAFKDVFGSLDGSIFADMTRGLGNFLHNLILTKDQMEKIRVVATVVFTVLKNLLSVLWGYKEIIASIFLLSKAFGTLQAITSAGFGLASVFGILKMIVALGLVGMLLGISKHLGSIKTILNVIGQNTIFKTIGKYVTGTLGILIYSLQKIWNYLSNTKIFSALGERVNHIGTIINSVLSKGKISLMDVKSVGIQLSGVFKDVINWAKNGLNGIKNFFTVTNDGAKEVSTSVSKIETPVKKTANAFDTVSAKLGNLFGCFNMVAYAAETAEKPTYRVVDGVMELVDATEKSTEAIKDSDGPLATHVENFQHFLDEVAKFSPAMTPFISNLKALVDGLKSAQGPLASVFGFILDVLSKIDWKRILPVAFIVGYIMYLKKLGDSINRLSKSITKIFDEDTLIGKLRGMTDSIKGFFSTLTTLYSRSNFINTAKGILYLSGAFALLAATIHALPVNELWAAAAVLSVLAAVVVSINVIMAHISTMVNPQGMVALGLGLALLTASMLGLATALGVIAGIMYVVSKSTGDLNSAFDAMLKPLEVLVIYISSALAGLLAVSATLAIIGAMAVPIAAGSAALVIMATALLAFSGAMIGVAIAANMVAPLIGLLITQISAMYVGLTALIQRFTEFDSANQILKEVLKGIGIFVGIAAATVAALALLAVGVTGLTAITLVFSVGLLGLSIALGVTAIAINSVSDAIERMANLTIPEASYSMTMLVSSLMKASGELQAWTSLGIATILVGLAAALKILTPVINSIAPGILALSVAALALGVAIKMWAGIPAQQILDGMLLITLGLVGMGAALKMLDAVNVGKIAGGIMALVVGLYMLTPLMALYGVAWPILIKGLLGVGAALGVLAVAVKLIGDVSGTDVFLSVAAILSALLGMTLIMIQIGSLVEENVNQCIAGFGGLIAMLALLIVATELMGSVVDGMNDWKQFAIVVGTMAGAVAILGIVMSALCALPANDVMVVSIALLFAMSSFTLAAMGLAKATDMINTAGIPGMCALLALLAVNMGVAAAALIAIQDVPWGVIIAFFAGFGLAVSGIVLAVGHLGASANAALPVLGMIALIAGALAAVWWAVSKAIVAATNGFAVCLDALGRFLPVFTQFLSSLADLSDRSKDIKETSSAVAEFGKSLIALGAGMGAVGVGGVVFGAGLIAAGVGVGAFTLALGVAAIAVSVLAASVMTAVETISEPVSKAAEWGLHLVQNFANGITSGISYVAEAVNSIAKTVKDFLGHSFPLKGWLSGGVELIWGEHAAQNFGEGMKKAEGFVGSCANGVGKAALDGIKEYIPSIGNLGTIAGNAFGNNLKTSVGNALKQVQAVVSQVTASIQSNNVLSKEYKDNYKKDAAKYTPGTKEWLKNNALPSNKLHNAIAGDKDAKEFAKKYQTEFKEAAKNNTFDISDLLGINTDNISKTIDDALGNLNTETPGGGGGAGGGGGSGSGGSDKENKEELKKQAEAAKLHEKYLKLSTKAALAYDGAYEKLNSTLDDTKPSTNAQNAITALAEHLYKASLTGDETAEELAEKAKKTEEVFITMYENIKSKTKDSLDFFKEFNRGFDDVIKPKQLMKNINSQIRGNIEMTEMWNIAAIRGFDSKLLKSLEEEGAEGMSKFRSLLQLSEDELSKYMKALEKTDSVADFVASTGMSSLAINLEILKLKERNEKRKEYVTEGKKIIEDWNSIENDGSLASQAAYDITAKRMQQLAEKYKVSVEEIQKAASDEADGIKSASEKELEYFDKVSTAYYKWVNTYKTKSEEMKQAIGDFMTSFSEFKTEEEGEDALTTEKIIDNLETRQKAMEEWYENLTELQEKGLNQKKFDELLAAGPEGSYQEVKLLAEASEEEFDKINDLLDEAAQMAKAKSEQFGIESAQAVIGGFDATLVPYFTQMIENFGSNFNFSQLAEVAGVTFNAIGEQITGGVKDGIETGTPDVKASTEYMAEGVDQKAEQYINKENGFGKAENFMLGILQGIEEYKDEVLSAIDEVCSAVGDCVQEDWEIHSPSHLTHRFAGFFIKGMINGFRHYGSDAVLAVKENAVDPIVNNLKKAMSTAYSILTSEDDFNPTITPVLDLSNIEAGSRSLSSLMTNNGFRVQANLGTVNTPASKLDSLSSMLKNGVMNSQNAGNNYNFVQNNYSPKALSRLDIYRQTKNQFAQLKGLVN